MKKFLILGILSALATYCLATAVTYPPEKEAEFIRTLKVNDLQTLTSPVFNVKAYGAVGDGTTNDTTAVQATYDAAIANGGGTVFFPEGTWRFELTMDITYVYNLHEAVIGVGGVTFQGAGIQNTRLAAITPGNFVLNITAPAGQSMWRISDLTFDGYAKTMGGIAVNANGFVSLNCRNVTFWQCTTGFKNQGALWYHFENCSFERGDYGVWLQPISTMHGGCGRFTWCNWTINAKAAVYVDAAEAGNNLEQLVFDGGINEGNGGFAFYVKDWNYGWPFVIQDYYLELNGTGSNVVIDDETFASISDTGVRFDDCNRVRLDRVSSLGELDVNASFVDIYDNYTFDSQTDPNITNGGELRYHHPYIDAQGPLSSDVYIVENFDGKVSVNRTPTGRMPLLSQTDTVSTNLWANGSLHQSFTPTDVNGATYSFVSDGVDFATCLQIELEAATAYDDGVQLFPAVSYTAGKYYVWSFDLKGTTGDCNVTLINIPASPLNCQNTDVLDGEWVRYYGVGMGADTESRPMYLYGQNAGAETIRLSRMQIVQFDDLPSAFRYINEHRYAIPSSARQTFIGNYSGTFDPNSLAADANDIGTVAATGAALGDYVQVAAPYDLQGIMATAYVSASNVVKIKLSNATTGTINLASGTWKVKVER